MSKKTRKKIVVEKVEDKKNKPTIAIFIYCVGLALSFLYSPIIGIIFNMIISEGLASSFVERKFASKIETQAIKAKIRDKGELGESAHQLGKGMAYLYANIFIGLPVMMALSAPYLLVFNF